MLADEIEIEEDTPETFAIGDMIHLGVRVVTLEDGHRTTTFAPALIGPDFRKLYLAENGQLLRYPTMEEAAQKAKKYKEDNAEMVLPL